MSIRTDVTLMELFRASPTRTVLYSLGPLLITAAQLTNSYVNDLSLLYPAIFGAVMVTFSIMITRYHMLELHTVRLEKSWLANE